MLVSARHGFWTFNPMQLVQGGAILDDQHPIVRRHPDLFTAVVPTIVEQATRAPGELSAARRAPTEDLEGDRPAVAASKAEWSAYAEDYGYDVDGLTKAQIVELITNG